MVIPPSGESHLFAANVSQQEQLRGVNKVELSPVNEGEPEPRRGPRRAPLLRVLGCNRGISPELLPVNRVRLERSWFGSSFADSPGGVHWYHILVPLSEATIRYLK